MKIGSIVRLVDPWKGNELYRDALGIVLKVYRTDKYSCDVRVICMEISLKHRILSVYQHRVKVLKE